jgi:RND family efflux transporter MFP subunit
VRRAALHWLPVPILLVGGLAAWGLALGRPQGVVREPAPVLPRVEVVALTARRHPVEVRTHGTVEPRTEIELVAETAGRVQAVSDALEAGGFFEADTLLVALDPRDVSFALERAEAGLLRARSEVAIARSRLARLRSLADSDVASFSQLEESEHALELAKAALRDARAAHHQARRELERIEIRAPFAGRVRDEAVDVGQFVSRGTPLAHIYAVDHAEVRLPIPARELAFLEIPEDSDAGPRVRLSASFAGAKHSWSGRVVRSEGAIDPRSRMLHLVARVDDPYALLLGAVHEPLTLGLFVEAHIAGHSVEDAFVLPRAALRGPDEVMVLDSDGRIRARRVGVIRRGSERVLVRAGLVPGERVLASAVGAVEGTAVRAVIVEPPAAPVAHVASP